MKTTIKKWFAITLAFSALCTTPLYAASDKPLLTLDEAVKSAFVYSNQVSLNSKENELLKEQLKALDGATYSTYQTTYLTKAKNEQQAQVLRDQITYDITNRYNNIILLQKEMENLDANIALNTQKLQDMYLKKDLGLVSTPEYNSTAIQLDIQKNTRAAKQESLNNDQAYFKILTGRNPVNYQLDETLKFESFRIPGLIDRYITNKIDEYLKYDQEILDLQSNSIITEGAPGMQWVTYLGKKYEIDSRLSTVENARKSLRQALISSYSTLLSLEEQIGTLQNQLILAKQQADISKLQYDVGLITGLDYNKQLLTISDAEYNLRKLITNYNTLKIGIQKPWAMSGGGM